MINNNAFEYQRCDLGTTSNSAVTRGDIDLAFQQPQSVPIPCLYCGNHADFRIIAKDPSNNSTQVEDDGYMCEHCANQGYLDKNHFGIRKL